MINMLYYRNSISLHSRRETKTLLNLGLQALSSLELNAYQLKTTSTVLLNINESTRARFFLDYSGFLKLNVI